MNLINFLKNDERITDDSHESAVIRFENLDRLIFGFPQRVKSGERDIYFTEGIILPKRLDIEELIGDDDKVKKSYNNVNYSEKASVFRNPLFFTDGDIINMYGFSTNNFRAMLGTNQLEQISTFLDELDQKYKTQ